jgi:hypothetical protein
MKTKRPRWVDSYRSLFFFSVLAIASGVALAQGDPSDPPTNAHAKLDGSGWECERGYESVGQSCVAIHVPSHAFLNTLGDGWECDRGYREAEAGCSVVEVPPNAFLDSTGHRWECAQGYQKVDPSCVAIQVPPTFLDSPGTDRSATAATGSSTKHVPSSTYL